MAWRVVPPSSVQIPRVCTYSGSCCPLLNFAYRALTFFDGPSHVLQLFFRFSLQSETPMALLPSVWPLPLSLAATYGISFDYSSSAYLDVSVRRVPLLTLCIHARITDSSSAWFPNSDICGSILICSSPQLFAACHVLLRLLMPRHSPCALFSLTISLNSLLSCLSKIMQAPLSWHKL